MTKSAGFPGFAFILLLCLHSFQIKSFAVGGSENNVKIRASVLIKWYLPETLKEVSGICRVDDQRMACVQDELGAIFIYNLLDARIEKKIDFSAPGDFEGITNTGSLFYVLRADGQLFEINTIPKTPEVKQYAVSVFEGQDLEGVFYEPAKNRILIGVKNSNSLSAGKTKGIFAFDIATKKISAKPVFEIDLLNPLIHKPDDNDDDKKKNNPKEWNKNFFPSDLAIHPVTKEIYLVDGENPSLLVLDAKGKMKNYIKLSKDDFPKPEGIAFSSAGDLFISSEGNGKSGLILRVELKPAT